MKQKKIQTKLTFNKQTVASLNLEELTAIQGGTDTVPPTIVGFTVCHTKCASDCCY